MSRGNLRSYFVAVVFFFVAFVTRKNGHKEHNVPIAIGTPSSQRQW
jgi:hypothetical protein